MTEFGENLKKFRDQMGWSQDYIAEKTGTSQQTVSAWECGDRKPKYPTLSTLSHLFNCHPDDLDPSYKYRDEHYETPANYVETNGGHIGNVQQNVQNAGGNISSLPPRQSRGNMVDKTEFVRKITKAIIDSNDITAEIKLKVIAILNEV